MKLTKNQIVDAVLCAVAPASEGGTKLTVLHGASKLVDHQIETEGPYGSMFYLNINGQRFTVTVSLQRESS